MARIVVIGTAGCRAELVTDDDGRTTAVTACGRHLSDRSLYFADTAEVAASHVDRCNGVASDG